MSRRQTRYRSLSCLLGMLMAASILAASSAWAGESEAWQKLPRFVSLRSDQVNLRVGPGENYPIEWVLTRKEMPVEIVKEFENWRMIRDWQGTEGWVHERMLTGKRAVVVKGGIRTLHRQPDPASPRLPARSPVSSQSCSNAGPTGAASTPPIMPAGSNAAIFGAFIPTKPCSDSPFLRYGGHRNVRCGPRDLTACSSRSSMNIAGRG